MIDSQCTRLLWLSPAVAVPTLSTHTGFPHNIATSDWLHGRTHWSGSLPKKPARLVWLLSAIIPNPRRPLSWPLTSPGETHSTAIFSRSQGRHCLHTNFGRVVAVDHTKCISSAVFELVIHLQCSSFKQRRDNLTILKAIFALVWCQHRLFGLTAWIK